MKTIVAENLEVNFKIVKEMEPKNINDFIPLLQLEPIELKKFEWMCPKQDSDSLQKHFIYYFSERAQVNRQATTTI